MSKDLNMMPINIRQRLGLVIIPSPGVGVLNRYSLHRSGIITTEW